MSRTNAQATSSTRSAVSVAELTAEARASIYPLVGGGLPFLASLATHLDVPAVMAPDNPVYWANGAHAPNEHIRLGDISPAVRFLEALLTELG